jgi:multiple sugar transport system permease protein
MASKFLGTQINPDRFHKGQLPFFIILISFSMLMILPILFIVNHAFKPQSELFAYPPTFFVRNPTLDNFLELARLVSTSGIPFSRYVLNSVVITVIGVGLAILFTALSAYGLAKLHFKGKKLLFEINTISLMFVPIAVQIPRYIVVAQSGMIDSYFAHIFFQSWILNPRKIFLYPYIYFVFL